MRLAFCLFKFFPYGGLQRDFLRIARECLKRGHMIDVYVMHWEGKYEPGLAVRVFPAQGIRNHTRRQNFVKRIQQSLSQGKYDLIVGFNKMPGLDVYYAADTCYQAKARQQHSWWYRWTRRYRQSVAFEEAVFSPHVKTEILLLSSAQQAEFMTFYHTPENRFHLLPPGIGKDRIVPPDAPQIRNAVRSAYSIGEKEFLLLMVGSGFKTKGLDRAILALAALPQDIREKSRLLVIGKDHAKQFVRQAKKLNIANRVLFLGGRDDVPRFLLAADILLHPAYNENTGTVILEAIVSGLPVLTTDVCGYASYVQEASAGIVLSSPFQQEQLNRALLEMLVSEDRDTWKTNALVFARHADIYSLPERAVSLLESFR